MKKWVWKLIRVVGALGQDLFFSQCPEIVIEEVVVVHFRKNMSFLRF